MGSLSKKYVTVNSRGKVTVRKSGKTVTITAAAEDGSGKKATYKITPVKNRVKKIIIFGKKKVKAGRFLQLTVKVTATGKSANKTVTWKSSNDKYAMVNKKGKVTATCSAIYLWTRSVNSNRQLTLDTINGYLSIAIWQAVWYHKRVENLSQN